MVARGLRLLAVRKIVDIGGGNGTLLRGILERCTNTHGVVFDLPHVAEGAAAQIRAAGLDARCTAEGGDVFQAVPSGGDAYILKNVLHDWDDERCATILRNCRRAMDVGKTLLVVESVVPSGNEPSFSKLSDVVMLVLAAGQERTRGEYENLLRAAGFQLRSVIPCVVFDIVEAVAA